MSDDDQYETLEFRINYVGGQLIAQNSLVGGLLDRLLASDQSVRDMLASQAQTRWVGKPPRGQALPRGIATTWTGSRKTFTPSASVPILKSEAEGPYCAVVPAWIAYLRPTGMCKSDSSVRSKRNTNYAPLCLNSLCMAFETRRGGVPQMHSQDGQFFGA